MKRETLIWLIIMAIAAIYMVFRASTTGMGLGYVEIVDGEQIPSNSWEVMAGAAQVSISRTIGIWVAALCTLFVMSFAYRDNPFYKVAEATFVGVSAAYWMVVGFWTTVIPNLIGKLFPDWINNELMPGLSPVRDEGWYMYFIPLALGRQVPGPTGRQGRWLADFIRFHMSEGANLKSLPFLRELA